MKTELMYSMLDYAPNVKAPEPLKNAGLYTGDVLFDKKPWGNNYVIPRTEPNAVAYSSHFYASHHIPSYNRPGNNTIDSSDYKKYNLLSGSGSSGSDAPVDNIYNFSCHTNVLG
jgi:hypothetical protein